MIDIHFPAHNRRAFVDASLSTLVENTNLDLVNTLYITDDRSVDGTYEHLCEAVREIDCNTVLVQSRFDGPVAAMNEVLDRSQAEIIGKIDSDTIVCPGWLETMLDVMDRYPEIDALGMEPGFAMPFGTRAVVHNAKLARWIGGVGLFRTRVFARRRPVQSDRFFGLTAHWRKYAKCAWIDPDLPCFLLDHLPFEPWQSLTRDYIEKGWQREVVGAAYTPEQAPYFEWWAPDWAPMFGATDVCA